MNREESESAMRALRATLPAALSAITGEAWTARPMPEGFMPGDESRWITLDRPEGIGLCVHADHYKARASVRCDTVTDCDGRRIFWSDVAPWTDGRREPAPEISVSLAKSADQIARDIARRILPDVNRAAPWFREALERVQASADQFDRACAMLESLGGTIQARLHAGKREGRSAYFTTQTGGLLRVNIREYGTVEIREDIPPGPTLESVIRALLASK